MLFLLCLLQRVDFMCVQDALLLLKPAAPDANLLDIGMSYFLYFATNFFLEYCILAIVGIRWSKQSRKNIVNKIKNSTKIFTSPDLIGRTFTSLVKEVKKILIMDGDNCQFLMNCALPCSSSDVCLSPWFWPRNCLFGHSINVLPLYSLSLYIVMNESPYRNIGRLLKVFAWSKIKKWAIGYIQLGN